MGVDGVVGRVGWAAGLGVEAVDTGLGAMDLERRAVELALDAVTAAEVVVDSGVVDKSVRGFGREAGSRNRGTNCGAGGGGGGGGGGVCGVWCSR